MSVNAASQRKVTIVFLNHVYSLKMQGQNTLQGPNLELEGWILVAKGGAIFVFSFFSRFIIRVFWKLLLCLLLLYILVRIVHKWSARVTCLEITKKTQPIY